MIVNLWLWFSLVVSAALFIQFILNLLLLPRLRPQIAPEAPPRVSVLLPDRNEAARIRPCLESLLGQNYPSLEIIVLD
ncbi:MAG: glycosyltransferase, partial [Chthoniobacterales bacterium]